MGPSQKEEDRRCALSMWMAFIPTDLSTFLDFEGLLALMTMILRLQLFNQVHLFPFFLLPDPCRMSLLKSCNMHEKGLGC